ncbi:MAG: response regulator [Nitrospirota bacterium]
MSDIKLHILLVEDDIAMQRMVSRILKGEGCTLEIAHNSREALDALKRNTFDLVLMDMKMAAMWGTKTTKIIRTGNGGSNCLDIPIIALTSFPEEEAREQCITAGMNGFLKKPFQMDNFLRELKTIISNGKSFSPGLSHDENER